MLLYTIRRVRKSIQKTQKFSTNDDCIRASFLTRPGVHVIKTTNSIVYKGWNPAGVDGLEFWIRVFSIAPIWDPFQKPSLFRAEEFYDLQAITDRVNISALHPV